MKEKLVKSYIFLGNLPIYNEGVSPGATTTTGCDFVINTRIKYELGVVSMQFIKQNHPSMYNVDSTLYPEIELDISSLIRFKKLIEFRNKEEMNPTQDNNNYVLVASTKLKKSLEYQKPAFIKVSLNNINVVIENNKTQHQFFITGLFQIECLYDLLVNVIQQLGSSSITYDIIKNYGNNTESKTITAPYISPIPSITPYVAPNPAWVMPTPIMCNNSITHTGQPVTTSVIPQMPDIPAAPKF